MKLKAELLFATLQLAGAMTFNKKGGGEPLELLLILCFPISCFL